MFFPCHQPASIILISQKAKACKKINTSKKKKKKSCFFNGCAFVADLKGPRNVTVGAASALEIMTLVAVSVPERALLLPGGKQPVQPQRHEVPDHLLHSTGAPADGRSR